jgi:hypothetical protein
MNMGTFRLIVGIRYCGFSSDLGFENCVPYSLLLDFAGMGLMVSLATLELLLSQ